MPRPRDPRIFVSCPRCDGVALTPHRVGGIERHRCAGCGGVWFDDSALRQVLSCLGMDGDQPLGAPAGGAVRLACPRCRELMATERAWGEGPPVDLDVCPAHGAWFDRDEFEDALRRIQGEVLARTPGYRGGGWSFALRLVVHAARRAR